MASSRRVKAAVNKATKLLADGTCRTVREAAAAVGVHESTLHRHKVSASAARNGSSPAAASATLRPQEPAEPEKWWPPGYTPGFTDYYDGMIPDDASAEQLDALADSHDHFMLAAVCIHPNTDGSTLTWIACQYPYRDVVAAMLTNPDLPSEALAEIYPTYRSLTPSDQQTRTACEAHPNWAGPDG